jgi:hypothetical protein
VNSDNDVDSMGNTEEDRLSDVHELGSLLSGSVDYDITRPKSSYHARNHVSGIDSSVRSNLSEQTDEDSVITEEDEEHSTDSGNS